MPSHDIIQDMAPHIMNEAEWTTLREMRLAALRESPSSFLSSYSEESAYEEQEWRAEFERGEWTLEIRNDKAIALVGVTREQGTPPDECYLEYLWVSPGLRGRGVATDLVKNVLRRLPYLGFTTVWLWVLDGNEPARRLYNKCGFTSTSLIQRPHRSPSRSEELMMLTLRELCKTPHSASQLIAARNV
jgi:ribosomal protein S18 acetylase RimI-like enzyme